MRIIRAFVSFVGNAQYTHTQCKRWMGFEWTLFVCACVCVLVSCLLCMRKMSSILTRTRPILHILDVKIGRKARETCHDWYPSVWPLMWAGEIWKGHSIFTCNFHRRDSITLNQSESCFTIQRHALNATLAAAAAASDDGPREVCWEEGRTVCFCAIALILL